MSHRSGIINGILKLVFAFVIMPLLAVASFLILLPSLPHLVLPMILVASAISIGVIVSGVFDIIRGIGDKVTEATGYEQESRVVYVPPTHVVFQPGPPMSGYQQSESIYPVPGTTNSPSAHTRS